MFHNNRWIGFDQGGTSLTAFDFTSSVLGAGFSSSPTKTGFPRIDVRHWSYRLAADSSAQVRDSIRYLANKWKVPILD
jgi:hypothetical protein